MDGFLRVFLAVLVGAIVAMGIPREIGREYRWALTWEHTIGEDVSSNIETVLDESQSDYFPAETDRRFTILDSASGQVVASGLKTEVFHASAQALINQSADAPRWAVQAIDGRMLRVVARRGVPRLHGATLLQFSDDSIVYGDLVTTGDRWELALPKNSTVYDLTHHADGRTWFAVGTLGGTVVLTSGGGGANRQWRYVLESEPDMTSTATIYGIKVAAMEEGADNTVLPPPVYIIHGFDPQSVSRIVFSEDGTAERLEIGQVSQEHVGHGPREIFQLEQNLLVSGLQGSLLVARTDDNDATAIPVEGLLVLSGVGRTVNDLVVATGRGPEGPLILSGNSTMSAVAPWQLADRSARATVRPGSRPESTVIVQREDRLLGLQLTL